MVSGGASGLGAAAARALARRGAPVTMIDLDAGRGARLAGEIHGLFCAADVTDPEAVADALDRAAAAHGRGADRRRLRRRSRRPGARWTATGGRTIAGLFLQVLGGEPRRHLQPRDPGGGADGGGAGAQ